MLPIVTISIMTRIALLMNLGCKFPHKEAKNCPFKSNCTRRLCPYRHEVTRNAKDDNNESDENVEWSDITDSDKSATDSSSLVTSTLQKRHLQCEECRN